jgi:aspartate oxidase
MLFDIAVVGRGIAGMAAAMEASKAGYRTAVFYDNAINSTSLAYEGVLRLPSDTQILKQNIQSHSYGIAKDEIVKAISDAYEDNLKELESLFQIVNAKPIGRKHRHGGLGFLADMEKTCVSHGVRFINGKVANICTNNGKVSAIQVFIFPKLITIQCKAVILAAGGGLGNVYASTDNYLSYCTPGHILALNAGAKLRDMEFISFHPFGVVGKCTHHNTTPIYTFFNIGVKTQIFGTSNEKRLELVEDLISSRTSEKNAHDNIFKIALEVHRHGGAYFFNKQGQREDLKVVAHSLIGGVDTNSRFETSVQGLYSIGELTGGLNGAGRMPGMALLEGFISGRLVANSAMLYADNNTSSDIDDQQLIPETTRAGLFATLLDHVRKLADQAVFIERNEAMLANCEKQLREMISTIKTKELAQYIEYDIAELLLTIVMASRMRTESRGFFQRTDYPDTDPALHKSILISRDSNSGQIACSWEQRDSELCPMK